MRPEDRQRQHGATVAAQVEGAVARYGDLLTDVEREAAITLAEGLAAVAAGLRVRTSDGHLLVAERRLAEP